MVVGRRWFTSGGDGVGEASGLVGGWLGGGDLVGGHLVGGGGGWEGGFGLVWGQGGWWLARGGGWEGEGGKMCIQQLSEKTKNCEQLLSTYYF